MTSEVDIHAVVAAVRCCPAVSDVVMATVAGAGPAAISVDAHQVTISVIAFYGPTVATVLDQIEHAVRPLIGDRALQVTVEDLDTTRREAWGDS